MLSCSPSGRDTRTPIRSYLPPRLEVIPYTAHCSWAYGSRFVLDPLRQGLHADEFESQTAYAVDDAVKLNLVDYLSREYRQPAFRLHLHPLEGLGVPSAKFASHYYPVDLPGVPMHRVFPVCSRLPVVPQRTSRRDLLSSPIGASTLGDFGFGRIARLASWRRSARRLPHARKHPASCRRTCHGFLPCWELLYGAPRVQRPTLARQPKVTSKLQSHSSYGPATSRCSEVEGIHGVAREFP